MKKEEKICPYCKKTFIPTHKNAQYCSEECIKQKNNEQRGRWATALGWADLSEYILERDYYKCVKCGSNKKLEIHHIKPLAKRGTNNASNLEALCEDCHKKAHKISCKNYD